ncbi:MAG: 2-dehydropantoate 2-reductase [Alphaproteobacteria bacterium]|nr:2-dehydropantoate 2-reductase [Alphaproteobacteria bacterium]
MRVCVYGAGAIGGHLAVRLAQNGHDVSVIARGATLAGIRAHGITITTPKETLHAAPIATDDPAALGVQDAVIVTAKSPALPAIAPALAPLLGAETPVAVVMNGIPWWYPHDPDGIAAVLPESRVIGGVIYSACTITAPGRITVEHPVSRLLLGEPDGAATPRLAALAAALRCPGLRVEETPSIRDWIWTKLLMNLSASPLALLTRSAPKDIYAEPACLAAARQVAAEGAVIAAAYGCRAMVDIEAQITLGQSLTHKPSILQDLEAGRPMEIGTLLEAPLALAHAKGIAAPMLEMLVALVRLRAAVSR